MTTAAPGERAAGEGTALGVELPAVSIGPETTRAAEAAGVNVVAQAERHDLDGLVEAVGRAALERTP